MQPFISQALVATRIAEMRREAEAAQLARDVRLARKQAQRRGAARPISPAVTGRRARGTDCAGAATALRSRSCTRLRRSLPGGPRRTQRRWSRLAGNRRSRRPPCRARSQD